VIIEEYGDWIASQHNAVLPGVVIHHGARAFIDWIAATVAGGDLDPARMLVRALVDGEAKGNGPVVIPGAQPASVRTCALINAAAAHTAEVDDIFRDGIYHPGAPTIAAALALAQSQDASGRDFLRAVVIGYEVSTRIAATVQPAHYKYWHTTGTIGTFGAAAAGAALLRLDGDRAAHALATAATFAAGLQQAFRSDAMSKPMHAGHAAEAGLLAAMGAEHGVTGALDVLTGDAGFGAAMAGSPDWSAAARELGERWNVASMTFKAHACCGHAFAPIDGALQLAAEQELSAGQVASITVETAAIPAEVAGNPDPQTPFEAKFSIPYAVAAALTYGNVQLPVFEPDVLFDPVVRDLVRRVRVVVDPELTAVFPAQRAARVAVSTADGQTLTATRCNRKGDPEDPLSDDDLGQKYAALVKPVLGGARAEQLAKQAWAIDEMPSICDLAVTRTHE
jgi:2-methylcitrate dehydratase PrpD